ncbi:MAG: DUF1439 domain-containing protein [Planctomycetota bacterium]
MKILLTIIVIVLLGLGAFLYVRDQSFTVRVHESTIQEAMQQQMPIEKRYLALVKVILSDPRLDLLAESDRFQVGLDATVDLALGDLTEPLRGAMEASGAIRYEAGTGEVFLVDPKVESLAVPELPDQYREQVETAMTKALASWYSEQPVYTLEATDLKRTAARRVLQSVTVDGNHLVIAFGLGEHEEATTASGDL